MNIVKHFSGTSGTDAASASASLPLPMTACGMPPDFYIFNGQGYDCSAPGLYYFWTGSGAPIYARLVYGGDLYSFVSGVSWHHIHGIQDESLTGQALANAGMGHKWRLRCGYISDLMIWWLPQYGYQVRKVEAQTLEPLNGVDDGHVMFEVFDGKWKMWDITNGGYFTDASGTHLSLGEIIDVGVANCVRVPIDGDEKRGSDVALIGTQPWCMSTYEDIGPNLASWYLRIFQSWSIA